MTPAQYLDALRSNSTSEVRSLWGRLVRAGDPTEFDHLARRDRRLAWILGTDFLGWLLDAGRVGTPSDDVELVMAVKGRLLTEPKDLAWIRKWSEPDYSWRLQVFSEPPAREQATWDGVFRLITSVYPEIANKLLRHADDISSLPAADIFDKPVEEVGKERTGGQSMTIERYASADDTLQSARRFLWHSLGLNEHFKGGGLTAATPKTPEFREYLAKNVPLSSLEHASYELDIRRANIAP